MKILCPSATSAEYLPSWKRQITSPFRAFKAHVPRGPIFTRRWPPAPHRPQVEK
jgi:hypothetical protein